MKWNRLEKEKRHMPAFETPEQLSLLLANAAKQSPTNQKIALYIEKNYLQIIFMTASELADDMGVSQGSVSRFFMMLGYHGYNEFLRNLQQVMLKKLTAPERLHYSSPKGHHHKGSARRPILDSEIRNLDGLEKAFLGPAYQAMLSMVLSPKRLILISARMSATLLPYAAYILGKMRENVSTVLPATRDFETLELLSPEDVNILAVAFPRYSRTLIEKCRIIKEKGIPITGLTDSTFSPLVPVVDHAVCVPITTGALFDVYGTPLTFLNLMLQDAAAQMPQLKSRIDAIEDIEKRNMVYFTK
ncbi:MAG: MurR/RpiR family transcriptional regulator [Selenomonadaceae bacterium]|nr:MurR/RpiR family transcriptional regulator [Selenomonadaceae bacterium]